MHAKRVSSSFHLLKVGMKHRRWAEASGRRQGKNFWWRCLFLHGFQMLFDPFLSVFTLQVISKLKHFLYSDMLWAAEYGLVCFVCTQIYGQMNLNASDYGLLCITHKDNYYEQSYYSSSPNSLYYSEESEPITREHCTNYINTDIRKALLWQLVKWCSCYV